MFWGIVPLGGLMLGLMTAMTQDWTLKRALIIGAVDLTFLLLALALYNPKRFSWALGTVLMLVFLWYCFYVVDQFFFSGHPVRWPSSRGEVNPINALKGLLVIGLPSLVGSIGIFARRREWARPAGTVEVREAIHPS
jgi:hypothetical protein